MRYASKRIRERAQQTVDSFSQPRSVWPVAAKWRNRVGFPRLIAYDLLCDAHETLRAIDPRVFRADEIENRERFVRIRDELYELMCETIKVDWERFEGKR